MKPTKKKPVVKKRKTVGVAKKHSVVKHKTQVKRKTVGGKSKRVSSGVSKLKKGINVKNIIAAVTAAATAYKVYTYAKNTGLLRNFGIQPDSRLLVSSPLEQINGVHAAPPPPESPQYGNFLGASPVASPMSSPSAYTSPASSISNLLPNLM